LALWAANDGELLALSQRSSLVKEASPASQAVSQAANVGLEALDRITRAQPGSEEQQKQQSAALAGAELQAHKSQLTIPFAPAIEKLIEASTAGGLCGTAK